jgi:hypothetical protein
MTTKYDSSQYRVLGVGERVERGDMYLNECMADRGEPPAPCYKTIGNIVGQDDDWTYLRPIEHDIDIPNDFRVSREASATRKDQPVATGVLDYFPGAIRAVALCSKVGNEQHNPGSPMHWDRAKSGDEADALMRHFMERGTVDTDGILHSTKVAWRALAMLQKELEGKQ